MAIGYHVTSPKVQLYKSLIKMHTPTTLMRLGLHIPSSMELTLVKETKNMSVSPVRRLS